MGIDDMVSAARISRPRYSFTIPEKSRQFPGDPATVVMQPFTLGEELDAARAAGGRGGEGFESELLRKSVVEIDGKPVKDFGFDWIEKASPPVRLLLTKALAKVTLPSREDEDAFFLSQTLLV